MPMGNRLNTILSIEKGAFIEKPLFFAFNQGIFPKFKYNSSSSKPNVDGIRDLLMNSKNSNKMKLVYSLLLALFLSVGAQAQNCNWTANVLSNNAVIFTPPGGIISPQYTFEWNFGDGTILQAGANPVNHNYSNQGTYYICMTIFDSSAVPVCTSCDTLMVGGCSISYTQTGTLFVFNANGTNPGSNINWSFGDGNSSTQIYPVHQYATQGTFLACLTLIDSSTNCFTTFCDSVSNLPPSGCAAGFSYQVSNGSSYFYGFNTGLGSVANYSWSFGDGTTGTGYAARRAPSSAPR